MKKIIIVGFSIMFLFFKNSAMSNYEKVFYDFKIESINGEIINFKEYENKVVLLVNTASYCGFTKQYDDLQKLWDQYKSKGLIVLGVPSNSFNQEKKKNSEIKKFKPKNAILSNLSPVLDYNKLKKILPKNVKPAYDGMSFLI